MKTNRLPAVLIAALVPFAIAAVVQGCKKEEPPPPMPVASETPAPPPPTVTLAAPVDSTDLDASSEDAKKLGVGKPPDLTGLRACCAALQGNAASMPPPQNMYAAAAASYCQATVNSVNTPGQKDALIAGIRNALRGAAVPGACH
jgi:hypothetical protein